MVPLVPLNILIKLERKLMLHNILKFVYGLWVVAIAYLTFILYLQEYPLHWFTSHYTKDVQAEIFIFYSVGIKSFIGLGITVILILTLYFK